MTYDISEEQKNQCLTLLKELTQEMGLRLSHQQLDLLIRYTALFFKWNKTYNLTSVRNIRSLIIRHIIDSLSLLPHLERNKRMLDVGSGAGLPGIPVAIARPDLMIALLDANGKKACFLRQIVGDLQLNNVGVLQTRIEDYHPKKPFDVITARAFSSIKQLLKLPKQCYAGTGKIIAMKGMYPSAELDELTHPYEVVSLSLPCEELRHRHLVIIDMAPFGQADNKPED